MLAFNPYYVDEIVAEANPNKNPFGLIAPETNAPELHGFEVTTTGRLVLPELCARAEAEAPKLNWVIF